MDEGEIAVQISQSLWKMVSMDILYIVVKTVSVQ